MADVIIRRWDTGAEISRGGTAAAAAQSAKSLCRANLIGADLRGPS
jgi:hypothetical protein